MQSGKRSISVDRAFVILTIVGNAGAQGLTLTALARESGLGVSTIHRYVFTLLDWSALEKCANGKLRLGTGLVSLAGGALRTDDFFMDSHPHLVDLARSTGETVHLAALWSDRLTYIDKVVGDPLVSLNSHVGGRISFYRTALGKSVLARVETESAEAIIDGAWHAMTPNTVVGESLYAELDYVKNQGWAIDNEESERGVCCVGAAITSQRNKNVTYGSVSISGPADRLSLDKCDLLAPRVLQLSSELARMCDERREAPH